MENEHLQLLVDVSKLSAAEIRAIQWAEAVLNGDIVPPMPKAFPNEDAPWRKPPAFNCPCQTCAERRAMRSQQDAAAPREVLAEG